ncbi:LacI family DNA-binding transcriptional regulator [Cohnella sp. GCM10012308]|uniref:LacI family DNA-binding transcriptional regulator n=1 Tax=Cohnella sp. GCM10012308 TaxID=3317329 RepID=UPI003619DF80
MATLKAIAERVGVSITAVSRVLNGDATLSIAETKRKLIFDIAQEIGYKTPRGRASAAARKCRVGVVSWYSDLEEMADPYYLAIRLSIERECLTRGFEMARLYLRENGLASDTAQALDGVIAIGHFRPEDVERMSALSDACVIVDSSPDESRFDAVVIDMRRAVGEALAHLYELGHREIGYIGARTVIGGHLVPDDRESACRDWLADRGLYRPEHVRIGERLASEDGYLLMRQALAADSRPTAFLIQNDSMAAGALRMLHEAGVQAPRDISIVGFNDNTISAFLQPPLTTVKVHVDYMGEAAVGLLADRLDTKRDICKKIVLPTRLMVRESTAKI